LFVGVAAYGFCGWRLSGVVCRAMFADTAAPAAELGCAAWHGSNVMFAGLDRVDWGSMRHAYGPATEVPSLLGGLVSEDPAVRESALDSLYGAVHHQGDVYDCTLALIPFLLEVAGTPGLPGRGAVLELLASIGGADWEGTSGPDDHVDHLPRMYFGSARRAVAAASGLLLGLLADTDPQVRRAVPKALLACRADAERVIGALRDRLPGETDPLVRAAIIRTVAAFGELAAAGQVAGADPARVGGWLAGQAASHPDPMVRVAAVAGLARCAPALLPPGVVPAVAELLRQVYDAGSPSPGPAGFAAGGLIGALRELSEREAQGRRAPEAAGLVRDLSAAFGDRAGDRAGLLTRLLRAPAWETRYDAVRPAGVLISGWRGDYEELVFLIGEQLNGPHPRLCPVAGQVLQHFGDLAAPAADALADSLAAAPRQAPHTRRDGPPAWFTAWSHGPPSAGPTLWALAALQDVRALPAVRWALEQPAPPGEAGRLAAQFGPAAADLVPLLRQRLNDLPGTDDYRQHRTSLAHALGRIGAAAAPAVPELLALLPDPAILAALGRIGAAAADAIPAMTPLLDHAEPAIQIAAASALREAGAHPGPLVPVLARHLDSGHEHDAAAAAEALARLGPAATTTAPKLQELLGYTRANAWLRLRAAAALWRATGDVNLTLPTLTAIWDENPYTRVHIANYIAEMGPAASPAAPLLRHELGQPRRHTARDHGRSSNQIPADRALLRACHTALAAISR
jgi:hypothetical protein